MPREEVAPLWGGLQPQLPRVQLSLGVQTLLGLPLGACAVLGLVKGHVSILSLVTVLLWLVSPELPALLGQLLK